MGGHCIDTPTEIGTLKLVTNLGDTEHFQEPAFNPLDDRQSILGVLRGDLIPGQTKESMLVSIGGENFLSESWFVADVNQSQIVRIKKMRSGSVLADPMPMISSSILMILEWSEPTPLTISKIFCKLPDQPLLSSLMVNLSASLPKAFFQISNVYRWRRWPYSYP